MSWIIPTLQKRVLRSKRRGRTSPISGVINVAASSNIILDQKNVTSLILKIVYIEKLSAVWLNIQWWMTLGWCCACFITICGVQFQTTLLNKISKKATSMMKGGFPNLSCPPCCIAAGCSPEMEIWADA